MNTPFTSTSRFSRRTLIISGSIVVVIALLAIAFFVVPRNHPAPQALQSIAIEYPANWQMDQIDAQEKSANVIFKLQHKQEKSAGVSVRALASDRTYSKEELSTQLEAAAKSLGESLTGFELLDKKVETIGKYSAIHISYLEKKDTKLAAAAQLFVITTPYQEIHIIYRAKPQAMTIISKDISTINTAIADYVSRQPQGN